MRKKCDYAFDRFFVEDPALGFRLLAVAQVPLAREAHEPARDDLASEYPLGVLSYRVGHLSAQQILERINRVRLACLIWLRELGVIPNSRSSEWHCRMARFAIPAAGLIG